MGCCGCRPVTWGGGVGSGGECGQCTHFSDSRTSLGGHWWLGNGLRFAGTKEKGRRSGPACYCLSCLCPRLHLSCGVCVCVWREGRVRDSQWQGRLRRAKGQRPWGQTMQTQEAITPVHTHKLTCSTTTGRPFASCVRSGGGGGGRRAGRARTRPQPRPQGRGGIDRCAALHSAPARCWLRRRRCLLPPPPFILYVCAWWLGG